MSGYVQVTDYGDRVKFKPHEIIHITLDAARPGLTGLSPMQAALDPVTAWLFAVATGGDDDRGDTADECDRQHALFVAVNCQGPAPSRSTPSPVAVLQGVRSSCGGRYYGPGLEPDPEERHRPRSRQAKTNSRCYAGHA